MTPLFDLRAWERFCADVRVQARRTETHGEVSPELWRGVCAQSYLGLFHPEPRRPPAGDVLYDAMACLARACASTFWQAGISSALCGRMLRELAPQAGAAWLAELANGTRLGCFAATEQGSGSDPASYLTALERRGTGWVLRGEKTRVANATNADVAAILCRAPDGLALAVVDLKRPGVERRRHASMGLRGLHWGALRFDDVTLGAEEVVLGMTMQKALSVVEWGQVIQAICGIGLGEAALAEAEAFVSSRASFGRPLSQHEVVRRHLDDARLEIDAAALLSRKAVAAKTRGESAGAHIVMAKIFATEAGVRACQAALTVCGGWGYSTELDVERLLRDAYGNIPSGLPNDRLRELLVAPLVGADPWARAG